MERLCILIAVIALPQIVVAQQTVAFRIDHVECTSDLCEELDPSIRDNTTSFSLDSIRAHFVHEQVRIAMGGNVFALPKISYPFGEPIQLHLSPRHTLGWKTSSAWPSGHPLNCSLVAQKGNKDEIRLRLQDDDSTKPLMEARIQSGGTIAFIIQRRDRTLQLLLVRPFTQEAERSDAPKDRASRFDNGNHNAGPR